MTAASSHSGASPERAANTAARSESRKRTEVVSTRWTAEEALALRQDAVDRNTTPAALLRAAYLALTAIETTQEAHRG